MGNGNFGALFNQIRSNLNRDSIRGLVHDPNRRRHTLSTVQTRLVGGYPEYVLRMGTPVFYEESLLGYSVCWNFDRLVPRLAPQFQNSSPIYSLASDIFENIAIDGDFAVSPTIIYGPTSNNSQILNNGIEIVGYEVEQPIQDHKGCLFIQPAGSIGVALPQEKDYLYAEDRINTVMLGTSLAFEVPYDGVNLVNYSGEIAWSQSYQMSSRLQRGFLAVSPNGDISYTYFHDDTESHLYSPGETVANSVLAMSVTHMPGTRICALEEAGPAFPLSADQFDIYQRESPVYFLAR